MVQDTLLSESPPRSAHDLCEFLGGVKYDDSPDLTTLAASEMFEDGGFVWSGQPDPPAPSLSLGNVDVYGASPVRPSLSGYSPVHSSPLRVLTYSPLKPFSSPLKPPVSGLEMFADGFEEETEVLSSANLAAVAEPAAPTLKRIVLTDPSEPAPPPPPPPPPPPVPTPALPAPTRARTGASKKQAKRARSTLDRLRSTGIGRATRKVRSCTKNLHDKLLGACRHLSHHFFTTAVPVAELRKCSYEVARTLTDQLATTKCTNNKGRASTSLPCNVYAGKLHACGHIHSVSATHMYLETNLDLSQSEVSLLLVRSCQQPFGKAEISVRKATRASSRVELKQPPVAVVWGLDIVCKHGEVTAGPVKLTIMSGPPLSRPVDGLQETDAGCVNAAVTTKNMAMKLKPQGLSTTDLTGPTRSTSTQKLSDAVMSALTERRSTHCASVATVQTWWLWATSLDAVAGVLPQCCAPSCRRHAAAKEVSFCVDHLDPTSLDHATRHLTLPLPGAPTYEGANQWCLKCSLFEPQVSEAVLSKATFVLKSSSGAVFCTLQSFSQADMVFVTSTNLAKADNVVVELVLDVETMERTNALLGELLLLKDSQHGPPTARVCDADLY